MFQFWCSPIRVRVPGYMMRQKWAHTPGSAETSCFYPRGEKQIEKGSVTELVRESLSQGDAEIRLFTANVLDSECEVVIGPRSGFELEQFMLSLFFCPHFGP